MTITTDPDHAREWKTKRAAQKAQLRALAAREHFALYRTHYGWHLLRRLGPCDGCEHV